MSLSKSLLGNNRVALFILSVFIMTGCGYKPSSHAIKNVFYDTVYVDVVVDRAEPENAPSIKDEINRMVYTRFKGRVVSEAQAQSKLRVSYSGGDYTPVSYDNDGYITRYRANVRVKFDMLTKQGEVSKTIVAVHESDIKASSLHSSALRTEAIAKGVSKALDEFLAYVTAKGLQSTSH